MDPVFSGVWPRTTYDAGRISMSSRLGLVALGFALLGVAAVAAAEPFLTREAGAPQR